MAEERVHLEQLRQSVLTYIFIWHPDRNAGNEFCGNVTRFLTGWLEEIQRQLRNLPDKKGWL